MTPDPSNPADPSDSADILDRATLVLREMKVPPGPSPELIATTQTSLRRAAADPHAGRMFIFRSTPVRIAAAIAIICGTIAVIVEVAIHHGKPTDQISKPGTNPSPNVVPPKDGPTPPTQHIEQPSPPTVVKNGTTHDVQTPSGPVLADGVIAGKVFFSGVAPKALPLPGTDLMPQCVKLHGGPILDESMIVSGKGELANVVISVSEGLSSWLPEEFPPHGAPAILDQKGCVFTPHVVAVMVGQPLLIKNSDPMLHNVQVMAVNNPPANLGQPADGENETEKFQLPEVFRVKCYMHPWMEAWVRVVDNPYFAVTGPDGRFTLHGLPPGTYTIKAWHEQLGVREMQVTIIPGRGSAVDFTFPPAPR